LAVTRVTRRRRRATRLGRRLAARPFGLAGAGLVVLAAAFGGRAPLLTVLALCAGPGLALLPVLPVQVRESPVAALAAAPALGAAATMVALISLSSADVRIERGTVVVVLGVLVLAGLALRGADPIRIHGRQAVAGAAALALALAGGALLQARVIGGAPVPGNDWAKYVLYGEQIARHGRLLIDNPYWMLGVPFREDPGAPALYGGFLALTASRASVLVHGIWPFALMVPLSTFAYVRAFWGDLAAGLAALLTAVLPISQDILGWHGLANLAALALLPLVLLYLTQLVSRGLRPTEAAAFGLLVLAVAAAHRLSLLVMTLLFVAVLGGALAAGAARRVLPGLGTTAIAAALLCPGVVYDLVERGRTFGGTQSYRAYLTAKVDLDPLVGDLTVVFTVLAIVAVVLAIVWSVRDGALAPPLALLAVIVALAYAYLIHVPLAYSRMAYYLPVALAPLVAVALLRILPARGAALAGVVAAAVIAAFAWGDDRDVRDFYAFGNSASLRGLDAVATTLRPGEVVVTDRCWSFQATWLLHTRTLAALEPQDIQPKAELARARQARGVLDGTPEGMALVRRLGIRYLLADPTCTDARTRPTRPPRVGAPIYLSKRLVVLELPRR
jgi:hypothetical protein